MRKREHRVEGRVLVRESLPGLVENRLPPAGNEVVLGWQFRRRGIDCQLLRAGLSGAVVIVGEVDERVA